RPRQVDPNRHRMAHQPRPRPRHLPEVRQRLVRLRHESTRVPAGASVRDHVCRRVAEMMSVVTEEGDASLADAIAQAIRSGSDELSRLEAVVDQANARLLNAGNALSAVSTTETKKSSDGFFTLLEGVVGDLKDRLNERRSAGSTFNLVFF